MTRPHYRLRCMPDALLGGLVFWLERDGQRVSILSHNTRLLARSVGVELGSASNP